MKAIMATKYGLEILHGPLSKGHTSKQEQMLLSELQRVEATPS